MLQESAAGIRAPGGVGDKIAAKEKGKNAGRQRRQTGAAEGTKGGRNGGKWHLVLLVPTFT